LRFDREVIHIVVAGYIVHHYCLRFGREVVCIVVAAYIVDHYCFRGVIAVFHIAVVVLCQTSNSNGQQYNSHNNMNHSSVKPQTVMVNSITCPLPPSQEGRKEGI
jgi:hypothetical protein